VWQYLFATLSSNVLRALQKLSCALILKIKTNAKGAHITK